MKIVSELYIFEFLFIDIIAVKCRKYGTTIFTNILKTSNMVEFILHTNIGHIIYVLKSYEKCVLKYKNSISKCIQIFYL